MSKCAICKTNKATVPDRNKPGRLVFRLWEECHSKRLLEDMRRIAGRLKNRAVPADHPDTDLMAENDQYDGE
jgi:hypothetical protein